MKYSLLFSLTITFPTPFSPLFDYNTKQLHERVELGRDKKDDGVINSVFEQWFLD